MSRMLEKEWDLAISLIHPLNVYKLSARVIRLAIESEHIESADFAFEVGILFGEASTEEVTYLLEHPSKDETNENQQVATRRRTKLFSSYHSFAGHLRDIPNTSTAVPVRLVPSAGPSNKGMLHHYWSVETGVLPECDSSVAISRGKMAIVEYPSSRALVVEMPQMVAPETKPRFLLWLFPHDLEVSWSAMEPW
ncbi:hypothetical protein PROQFM164_S02g002835 [Penicillium roqueforti FM164]|uniref:Str. FM013 n=2 Tax=Penicillium TaxID=5073 RepID=A0A0G4PZ49_PENC3|nr:hypothetical protein PROQFM164_S02g002835 [Penicillium roqueforti FM164]CRL31425.1 unnamed protein product [Penicillium camemberti]